MTNNDFRWEKGSFRDPTGSIFFLNNSVFRSISADSVQSTKKLLDSSFFQGLMSSGKIVKTNLVNNVFDNVIGDFVLEHETIPFVNYPYEWSFGMLKDAALLTLDILKDCINNGFILKDGTAWNLAYYKGRMVFFDVLSIEAYEEGQTWNGYQQFCQEFLNPLLLKAHKKINFNDFFRGSLCGVEAKIARHLFKLGDLFKPGIFKHVFLNSYLASNKKIAAATIDKKYKLPKVALLGLVNGLIKIIAKLNYTSEDSIWVDYSNQNTYTAQAETEKVEFIEKFSSALPVDFNIVDLGCNTGKYSWIVSQLHNVVACDVDTDCIDELYRRVSRDKRHAIAPIVLNLMNPSSNVGWDLAERKAIFSRLKADAFLSLALIHHICIANNVPLQRFIEFLSKVAPRGILEWVEKDDPMVKFLLRNRKDIFLTYSWDNFLKAVERYFSIREVKVLSGGCRRLCWLKNK